MSNDQDIARLLKWLSDILRTIPLDYKSNIVVHTPWSVVIKAEMGQDCFYLKRTPSELFIEHQVIDLIQQVIPNAPIAKVLFVNHELHSFIMNSCGHYSLRTKFNGSLDGEWLIKGITSYIKIQRALEPNIDDFMAIGVPDWRIARIPDLYVELLENKEMLIEEGLTPHEIDQLMRLVPKIRAICESLSKYPIKETLVNCDFNENNMILNEDTGQISIIDWGEVVISHPLFSLASHLHNTTIRYKLESKRQLVESIKQRCLSSWLDVADKQTLDNIYHKIQMILSIFVALAIQRLQKATNNQSKEMQRWLINGILQKLLLLHEPI